MGIIVATYTMAMGKRDEKKIESELEAIKMAIEYYHTEYNVYPEEGLTPDQNSLFLSLTQNGEKGKKNFLRILETYVYMICQKWAESGRGKRSRADTLGKWRHAPN